MFNTSKSPFRPNVTIIYQAKETRKLEDKGNKTVVKRGREVGRPQISSLEFSSTETLLRPPAVFPGPGANARPSACKFGFLDLIHHRA